MVPRAAIEFIETAAPIREPVTKFGGQPVWLQEPQWPTSRQTGRPMRFIAQIALDPNLFGPVPGRVAYLFMTDDDDEYVDCTWEPDGGENAVVIQPGTVNPPVIPNAEGPTLYRMVQKPGQFLLVREPCEFKVNLTYSEDPHFVDEVDSGKWDEETFARYAAKLDANKVGGTPIFIQGTEFPSDAPWKLLLQLRSTNVPFAINFGDDGVGYAFLSNDGAIGKFLWQCY